MGVVVMYIVTWVFHRNSMRFFNAGGEAWNGSKHSRIIAAGLSLETTLSSLNLRVANDDEFKAHLLSLLHPHTQLISQTTPLEPP
jgi:hypothetical protein